MNAQQSVPAATRQSDRSLMLTRMTLTIVIFALILWALIALMVGIRNGLRDGTVVDPLAPSTSTASPSTPG